MGKERGIETGIYYWFGYPLPIRERFSMIAAAGFDAVSLWWGDDYIDLASPKEEIPDQAREYGLYVENVHAPFEHANALWADDLTGEDLYRLYADCIDGCGRCRIPAMVLHLTKTDTPPPSNALGIGRLRRLAERAEKRGVLIALENLRQPQYLDYVFRHIESDTLEFCYDSGHWHCFSPSMDVLGRYGDRLAALHLHDNDGTDDQHRLPGEGSVPWDDVINELVRVQYHGPVTLEVVNPAAPLNPDAGQFLALAYAKAKELSNKIETMNGGSA